MIAQNGVVEPSAVGRWSEALEELHGRIALPASPARRIEGEDVVRFLKHLMRRIGGEPLVIRDGSPIHRGQAVKGFLSSGAAARPRPERLPGYAPDLNPDEGTWKHL